MNADNTQTLWLGPAPTEEAPPGDDPSAALRTCRRYQAAVRLLLGDEPHGARLRVLTAPPDRAHPVELAVEFDPTDPAAAAYAERCRTSAPSTWAAAGLTCPDDPEPAVGRG